MSVKVILWFIVASLINVMLGTAKNIFTVKGTKMSASIINAINFSFYTIIIKQISDFNIAISIIVTFATNLIGVWAVMALIEKFKKDTLWVVSITAKNLKVGQNIIEYLNDNNIAFRVYDIRKKEDKTIGLDIFSETQEHSMVIKKILDEYDVKYHVTETINRL